MNPEQYNESKKVLPQDFEFDEDFDPECFEENLVSRDPASFKTKSSMLFESKK